MVNALATMEEHFPLNFTLEGIPSLKIKDALDITEHVCGELETVWAHSRLSEKAKNYQ